jgi:hypothetical protein
VEAGIVVKKKTLIRRVPCTIAEFKKVQRIANDAIRMASVHDPDLEKRIVELERHVAKLDRLLRVVSEKG